MLPDSSANLIIALFRQCSHTVGHTFRIRLAKAAYQLLKIACSRFFLSEFVYDIGGRVYVTWKFMLYSSALQPFLVRCTLKDILTNSCTLFT